MFDEMFDDEVPPSAVDVLRTLATKIKARSDRAKASGYPVQERGLACLTCGDLGSVSVILTAAQAATLKGEPLGTDAENEYRFAFRCACHRGERLPSWMQDYGQALAILKGQ